MSRCPRLRIVMIGATALWLRGPLAEAGQAGPRVEMVSVQIPQIDGSPRLEDFLDMRPADPWRDRLLKIDGLVQRYPVDGQLATERTEAYLGYDAENLYAIFVSFDSEPERIRARLNRREGIPEDEDGVALWLDTFHDGRRAYVFNCNALGVQRDSIYTEDSGYDLAFDTLWNSRGVVTDRGFVVWMAIPFKSLRFRPTPSQEWGVFVHRAIPRRSEYSYWPPMSSRVQSRLTQAAVAVGLRGISPGRNIQLIPFSTMRFSRVADHPDQASVSDTEANLGLDSKIVLKDSLVLDLTVNPDFSQVEADDPQSVVNERYEVFYPEKRPFFTENSTYFDPALSSPGKLLFTRRIVDPRLGVRLTGKIGGWAIGGLVADDQAPGRSVPPGDSLQGTKAYFGALRVSRDLPGQSTLGLTYTERDYEGSHNRLVGFDGGIRLSKTWSAGMLVARSTTRNLSGAESSGSLIEARLLRQGRTLGFDFKLADRDPDFRTQTGFVRQSDIRYLTQTVSYTYWRDDSGTLSNIKPSLYLGRGWDKSGTGLFTTFSPSLTVELTQPTTFTLYYWNWSDVLRPKDYPVFSDNRLFRQHSIGFRASSSHLRIATFGFNYSRGARVNYVPPTSAAPGLADFDMAEASISLRPLGGLSIGNSYLLDRNWSRLDERPIYSSHIFRSTWNWQLTRELSVRFIGQYDGLITDRSLTATPTRHNLNADFLISYLVHPGTAIHVGYNSNMRRPGASVEGPDADRFVNDSRQFFVKVSYLLRM